MRNILRLSILLVAFTAAPAMAQGTPQQREACSNDAFRFCDAYVPDAPAVEKCLRANMANLSRACRHEFGATTPTRRGGRR